MTSASSALHGQPQEDDGDVLVQQVIAENSIPEAGVREEWGQKIGWHRKENIFSSNDVPLLGARSDKHLRQRMSKHLEQSIPNFVQDKRPLLHVTANASNVLGAAKVSEPFVAGIGFAILMFSGVAVMRVLCLVRAQKLRSL